jgi:hypothetical protein
LPYLRFFRLEPETRLMLRLMASLLLADEIHEPRDRGADIARDSCSPIKWNPASTLPSRKRKRPGVFQCRKGLQAREACPRRMKRSMNIRQENDQTCSLITEAERRRGILREEVDFARLKRMPNHG